MLEVKRLEQIRFFTEMVAGPDEPPSRRGLPRAAKCVERHTAIVRRKGNTTLQVDGPWSEAGCLSKPLFLARTHPTTPNTSAIKLIVVPLQPNSFTTKCPCTDTYAGAQDPRADWPGVRCSDWVRQSVLSRAPLDPFSEPPRLFGRTLRRTPPQLRKPERA